MRAYGSPDGEQADGRIDRILAHEYTHLLTGELRRRHGWVATTPLEEALWDCYHEGFGNDRSLSSRWLQPDGALTAEAQAALARLTPLLGERLLQLSRTTDPTEGARLRAGLADGNFDEKWGAMPVALWLAEEARGDDRGLSRWADAGPAAVLSLACAHGALCALAAAKP